MLKSQSKALKQAQRFALSLFLSTGDEKDADGFWAVGLNLHPRGAASTNRVQVSICVMCFLFVVI